MHISFPMMNWASLMHFDWLQGQPRQPSPGFGGGSFGGGGGSYGGGRGGGNYDY